MGDRSQVDLFGISWVGASALEQGQVFATMLAQGSDGLVNFGNRRTAGGHDHRFPGGADFFEQAEAKFRVEKVDLRSYIYYRNMPNSISATVKKNNAPLSN